MFKYFQLSSFETTNTVVRCNSLKSRVATLLFSSDFLSLISVGGFQEEA